MILLTGTKHLFDPDFFVAGMYWLDPNEGSIADKIQVYCDFSGKKAETCVFPKPKSVRSFSKKYFM